MVVLSPAGASPATRYAPGAIKRLPLVASGFPLFFGGLMSLVELS